MNKQMALGFVFVAMSTFLHACEHDLKVCNYCFAERTAIRLENVKEAQIRANAFYTKQFGKKEVTLDGKLRLTGLWRAKNQRYTKSLQHLQDQLQGRGIIGASAPFVSSKKGRDGFALMLGALRNQRDVLESEDLPS